MNKLSSRIIKATQKGFTLIELVIVIVIVGILAAVAIPNFSSTTTSANQAANTAILGAVKSAWTVAYANAKGAPAIADVAAAVSDPSCVAGTGIITCVSKSAAVPATGLVITVASMTSTKAWVCAPTSDCN